MTQSEYQFRGWDQWELVECWNLAPKDDEEWGRDNEKVCDTIINFLWEHYESGTFDEVKSDLMRYIEALARNDGQYAIVWKALLEIKNDLILLQFVSALLPLMWS